MKNLKRALSLALSSVMLLGMMVVGTGAKGYDDVTAEHNVEAIEVLEAMGVMEGTGNGFNPDAKVTRQEMAVIMCNVLDLTVSSYKGTTTFTDVDTWALPYVEACYTNGIISGYSATEFGAKDSLTTGQAALMLMKALGYFQEAGDFGQDWLVATTKQGAIIDLFSGVKNGAKEALTRNDVAQLVLNALKADMVEIDSYDVVADGKGGFTTKANYESRTNKVNIDYTVADKEVGDDYYAYGDVTLQLIEDLYGNTFKTARVFDAYGRPCTEWTQKLDTIGLYGDTAVATFTAPVTKHDMYATIGSSVYGKLEDNKGTLYVTVDGKDLKSNAGGLYDATADCNYILAADVDLFAQKNVKSTKAAGTGYGVQTEVYVDGTTVYLVQVNTYLVRATGDYNAAQKKVMFEAVAGAYDLTSDVDLFLSSEDFDGLEDIQDGDFLLLNAYYSATKGKYVVTDVAVAEIMTGKVDSFDRAYDSSYGKNVVVDGTTYNYSAKIDGADDTPYVIGEQASFVMDGFGNVIAVADAVAAGNLAYVLDVKNVSGLLGGSYEAMLIFADGSSAAVALNKIGTDKVNANNYTTYLDSWAYYVKHSNGSYSLNSVSTNFVTGTVTKASVVEGAVVNGDKIVAYNTANLGLTSYMNNKDSVLFVLDEDYELSVYTGVGNMPEIYMNAADAAGVKFRSIQNKNAPNFIAYAMLDMTAVDETKYSVIDKNATPDFIFVLDKVSERHMPDGLIYYTYNTLMSDGTVKQTSFEGQAELAYTLVYKTYVNKDGYVTKMDKVGNDGRYFYNVADDSSVADKVYVSGSTLHIEGQSYVFTSSTKIVLVSAEKKMNVDAGAKHEIYNVTASQAATMIKQLKTTNGGFNGTFAGCVVEDGSEILDTLYIYVNDNTKA